MTEGKMTILYDHQAFDMQDYGGISRYFSNLIHGIKERDEFKVLLPLQYSTNYYIRDLPQQMNYTIGRALLYKQRRRTRWNRKLAKKKIANSDFDIFHPTYFNPYFLDYLRKPMIVTVHDMIYENFPDLFPEAEEVIRDKQKLINSADQIIAISEFTKQQVIKHFPGTQSKITVIYHGLPNEMTSPSNIHLPHKYLLYVGDRAAVYKNFISFLETIAPILTISNDLHLICAGGGPFTEPELNQIKKLKITGKTLQIRASDHQLVQLYQQAIAFIYPSLQEGFGLPMLEAFKNECPIACSDTSCFPEVGGKAVTYFDPLDIHAMRQKISQLIYDPDLRQLQKTEGLKQLRKFTFENSLDQTIACYKKITL